MKTPPTAAIGAALLVSLLPRTASGQAASLDRGIERPPTAATPRAAAMAVRAQPRPPTLDGRLDDAAWVLAASFGDFTQRDPDEGMPATERTEVRVVFADDALYVGVRAWDSQADQIAAHLTRRDENSPSDWIGVAVDSYHDRRTAFYFLVNPAGVKRDVYLFNDFEEDASWDAVWEVSTSRDGEGWTAEFRIPFSQLRFTRGSSRFGFNVTRRINRLNEESHWRLIPRNSNAMVSLFGDLEGVESVRPPRRLEILPYSVARGQNNIVEPGNPFTPARSASASVGGDLKLGVGPNLTLDATINPDFGQVEADPAIVNLSAFETFYPERRPFFTEGANIFRFPISLGDGGGANEQLFYSRRVGRVPQGDADARGGFAETVDHTTILAAGKLSGKTASGWTIGLLGALTREMSAEARDSAGVSHFDVVEPRTAYVVGRLAREWRRGRTVVGLFGTMARRDLPAHLSWLRSGATTLGLDWNHRFAGDRYRFRGWAVGSRVTGSPQAITEAQLSSARYFQRPDNDYALLDTTRTSLSGLAAQATIGKEDGRVRFSTGFDTRTPGFEVNDAGYMRNADRTIQFAWVGLRWNRQTALYRRLNLNFNQYTGFSWGWENTGLGGNINGSVTFNNYWGAYAGVNRNQQALSTQSLRGGPALLVPGNVNGWGGLYTDGRRKVFGELNGWFFVQDASGARGGGIDPYVALRPSGRVELTLGPGINWNRDTWQYLQTASVAGHDEFFFGDLRQTTISANLRGNITFSPTLSLQLFASPYYSAGQYRGVQRVLDPRGARWADRMRHLTPSEMSRDSAGAFLIDLDGDAATDVAIDNPDFSFTSFRSNVVLRWEYRPGSTLFLVWQQGRSGSSGDGRYRFGDATRALFASQPVNVFMVKVNYWFSL